MDPLLKRLESPLPDRLSSELEILWTNSSSIKLHDALQKNPRVMFFVRLSLQTSLSATMKTLSMSKNSHSTPRNSRSPRSKNFALLLLLSMPNALLTSSMTKSCVQNFTYNRHWRTFSSKRPKKFSKSSSKPIETLPFSKKYLLLFKTPQLVSKRKKEQFSKEPEISPLIALRERMKKSKRSDTFEIKKWENSQPRKLNKQARKTPTTCDVTLYN